MESELDQNNEWTVYGEIHVVSELKFSVTKSEHEVLLKVNESWANYASWY